MDNFQQHKKEFSQEDYDRTDKPSREAIRRYFSRVCPLLTLIDGGQMDVDIIVYRGDNIVGYMDLEHKQFWKGATPPDKIHWLGKKAKYISELPSYYIMFNDDFTYFYFIAFKELLDAKIVWKYIKNRNREEDFRETEVIAERIKKVDK